MRRQKAMVVEGQFSSNLAKYRNTSSVIRTHKGKQSDSPLSAWTVGQPGQPPPYQPVRGRGGRLAAQKHTWGCHWQKPLDRRTNSIKETSQPNLQKFVTESAKENEKNRQKVRGRAGSRQIATDSRVHRSLEDMIPAAPVA